MWARLKPQRRIDPDDTEESDSEYEDNFEITRDPDHLEYYIAKRTCNRISKEKFNLEMWFSPAFNPCFRPWNHLQGAYNRRVFWDNVLSFTLTKWSRLSLDE